MRIHLDQFIGHHQTDVINEAIHAGEEADFFLEKYEELAALIEGMPLPYVTDGQGLAAVAYLHYFSPSMDWYITERDHAGEQMQAFGLSNMGGGLELGYINIHELIKINAVELDLHWTPKPLGEIVAVAG